MAKNTHMGSSFHAFLKEEGTYAEVTAQSIKRALAWQLQQTMEKQGISKRQMARAMKTSRSQLDRILDPTYTKVQLETVYKAASVLGRTVRLEIV